MTVLSVSHLSKKFAQQLRRSLWYGMRDIARELWPGASEAGLRRGEFWALDDVSFELARGESLALVGDNGAGKSTLLKVLFGLLKPDRGEVRLRGRAEALIELGTGFSPLLTGRENIRVGAALQGLDRRTTDELLEAVIDFAELGDFIDAPLQAYSSGMKARLSYALAAQLRPDLLIVDEVLAVGDFAFQRKCANHMRSYLAGGGSLLLVSHNIYQVQAVCERGILLDQGRVQFQGTAVETLNAMFERRAAKDAASGPAAASVTTGSGPIVIEEVRTEAIDDGAVRSGEAMRLTVRYRARERADVYWGFSIWTADQWICVAGEHEVTRRTIHPGEGELTCVIPRLPLVGGRYSLRAAIVEFDSHLIIAHETEAVLEVRADPAPLSNAQMGVNQLVTIDVEWL
ncbi:MAG TPA: ABC transporter ATP-binding protein [Thermoanaerobaculia bacterium]|jgi:ABC-type polysaccharide/polyol phosphate transport system ATPase subunit